MSSYKQTKRTACLHVSEETRGLLYRAAQASGSTNAPMLNDEAVNFALEAYEWIPDRARFFLHSQSLVRELNRYRDWHEGDRAEPYTPDPKPLVRRSSLKALIAALNTSHLDTATNLEAVAIPLFGQLHWSLLVLDIPNRRIRHYDSLPGSHRSLAQLAIGLLKEAGVMLLSWPLSDGECHQQAGSWECGYSLVACAAYESGTRLYCLDGDPREVIRDRARLPFLANDLFVRSDAGLAAEVFDESRLSNYFLFE